MNSRIDVGTFRGTPYNVEGYGAGLHIDGASVLYWLSFNYRTKYEV